MCSRWQPQHAAAACVLSCGDGSSSTQQRLLFWGAGSRGRRLALLPHADPGQRQRRLQRPLILHACWVCRRTWSMAWTTPCWRTEHAAICWSRRAEHLQRAQAGALGIIGWFTTGFLGRARGGTSNPSHEAACSAAGGRPPGCYGQQEAAQALTELYQPWSAAGCTAAAASSAEVPLTDSPQ